MAINRREFTALIAGGLLFPRKIRAAQSEGLSHEQMAEVILNHPDHVHLYGDTNNLGKTRNYYYDDEIGPNGHDPKVDRVGEWSEGDSTIIYNYTFEHHRRIKSVEHHRRIKSVVGCRVEVRYYNLHFRRISREEWFDLSDPKLKLIRCMNVLTRHTSIQHFARFDERWIEL